MAAGGLHHWLVQRGTAAVLALGLPAWGVYLAFNRPDDVIAWRALFASWPIRIAMVLTFAVVAIHAYLGVRDVVMDYVKPVVARLVLYGSTQLILGCCVLWLAAILWSL
jgi:succinate dehydrogenase / fumarate reductase, membrane anchor subunit